MTPMEIWIGQVSKRDKPNIFMSIVTIQKMREHICNNESERSFMGPNLNGPHPKSLTLKVC